MITLQIPIKWDNPDLKIDLLNWRNSIEPNTRLGTYEGRPVGVDDEGDFIFLDDRRPMDLRFRMRL